MPENESKKLQAFLPPQVCDRLDNLAKKMGITRAELSKRILTEWLEEDYEKKLEFGVMRSLEDQLANEELMLNMGQNRIRSSHNKNKQRAWSLLPFMARLYALLMWT